MAKRRQRAEQTLGPYAELGLAEGADDAAVRRAYRELVKRLHPDAGGSAEDQARLDRVIAAYRSITGQPSTGPKSATAARPARKSTEMERLTNLATNGRTAALRVLGVRGLRRLGRSASLPHLAAACGDENEEVAVTAVQALTSIDCVAAMRYFREGFSSAPESARAAMINSIALLSQAAASGDQMELVMSGLTDQSSVVRRAALHQYAEMIR